MALKSLIPAVFDLVSIANFQKTGADSFLVLPGASGLSGQRTASWRFAGISGQILPGLAWRKRLFKLGQRVSYLEPNGFEELDSCSL